MKVILRRILVPATAFVFASGHAASAQITPSMRLLPQATACLDEAIANNTIEVSLSYDGLFFRCSGQTAQVLYETARSDLGRVPSLVEYDQGSFNSITLYPTRDVDGQFADVWSNCMVQLTTADGSTSARNFSCALMVYLGDLVR